MVLRWLETTERRWLLLFDNADAIEPGALHSCLPKLGHGASLITSRNPNWGRLAQTLRLNVFSPEEAAAFLVARHPISDAVEDCRNRMSEIDAAHLADAQAIAFQATPQTTARVCNNAGYYIQQALGDYAGARPLLERALAICEAKLGPNHPNTKTVRDNWQSLP